MPIKSGDIIKIAYIGTLEDGTVFDSVSETKPAKFQVGSGNVIKGIERAVIGMAISEEKDIKILPKDGYGSIRSNLIRKLKRDKFPKNITENTVFFLKDGKGEEVPGRITKISNDWVVVDLNHPLAGKTLYFHLKIVGFVD